MNTEGRTEGANSSSNSQSRVNGTIFPEKLQESIQQVEPSIIENGTGLVAIAEIQVGQNVEQQPIYVPDPEVRETMEERVLIAWEREHSGQRLRMQDTVAMDYYNVVLRHLPQPINSPNQPVLPLHLQQSNYDAQNEPWWLQYLTNRWIGRVEAMLTNIVVERFEFVDDSPENEESCRIFLEDFVTGEEIRRLDYGHRFHITCTQEWFLIKNACPLCNRRGVHLIGDRRK